MQNIDKIFEDLDTLLPLFGSAPPGLTAYRATNNRGTWVADLRIGCQLTRSIRISLVCNNLGNAEYTLRPMMTEQPRTTAFQLACTF